MPTLLQGYVVSDANAISNIRTQHHYTTSDEETVTKSIKAGCNLELGSQVFLKQVVISFKPLSYLSTLTLEKNPNLWCVNIDQLVKIA